MGKSATGVSAGEAPATRHWIKRQGLHETLADSLRERILNGEFKEGEQLVQEAIAAEYQVSRMPVREAFRQLEAAGLISHRLHHGAVVTELPLDQSGELFDLRALLEGEILALAAPRATEESIEQARTILAKLEDAYHRNDIGSWGRLNWDFHRSLYITANRVQTMATIQFINVQTDRYIRLQTFLTDALEQAELEHRELFRLYAARNAEQAVPYLRDHILNVKQKLLAAISRSRSGRQQPAGA